MPLLVTFGITEFFGESNCFASEGETVIFGTKIIDGADEIHFILHYATKLFALF